MLSLMASFLDARMKGGVGISEAEKEAIYENIRSAIIDIAAVEVAGQGNQAQQQIVEQGIVPPELIRPLPAVELDMFDEIYYHYLDENENRAANVAAGDPGVTIATATDAELALYKQEPSIRLKNDHGSFNCPLTWWKFNERQYKLLSILAARLLCIPATSAPSERVFSTACITIAKDHARLASQTANELIFLHDALPALHKLHQSDRL